MKNLILIAVIFIVSCSKENDQQPVSQKDITYKNLGDFHLDYDHALNLDMNDDHILDFSFASSMLYDPLNTSVETLEFRAYTMLGSVFFFNDFSPLAFNQADMIRNGDSASYRWTRNNAYLANRIHTSSPELSYWEGAWKDKSNKYLGVKLKAGDKFYTGWIRLSMGATRPEIIIHDCAFNNLPGADIRAGDK